MKFCVPRQVSPACFSYFYNKNNSFQITYKRKIMFMGGRVVFPTAIKQLWIRLEVNASLFFSKQLIFILFSKY